ncbi:DUF6264 family protein [Naasia lichenicola]|uniref:Uncharacterized protein n=1 Tax=Naasia lichenicola TaxID=2565933 RepID=A0A4V3WSV1_9MICO|nr:hypothetical protein [Naasia lichenicola]THG29527.1 hypothetical protein E6C64_12615 [Naasia lichenicola]
MSDPQPQDERPTPGVPAYGALVAAPSAAVPKEPRKAWDLAIAIVLLVLLLPIDFLISYAGAFLAFASDSCTADTCSTGQLSAGVIVALTGPTVVLLIGLVVAIIRIVRRRLAFWVPIVALAGMIGIWAIGAALVFTSVSG